MTPRKSTISHDPKTGKWGDCWRACLASLLDLEPHQVPHFHDRGNPRAWEMTREWLVGRGLCLVSVPIKEESPERATEFAGSICPDAHYLVTGRGHSGALHTVVCKGAEVVHDPTGSGLLGPNEEAEGGVYWVSYVGKLV